MKQKNFEYYKNQVEKIYEWPNNCCPYYKECQYGISYGCETFTKFRFDRARIGKDYGKDYPYVPKIVMIGLEGISDSEIVDGINTVTKVTEPSLTANNPHYNGLKYVLSYILADFLNKPSPEMKVVSTPVDWIEEALKRYALCNLYKCAFVPISDKGKRTGLQHSKCMKKNCIELLDREIEALEPDIVVIQVTNWSSLTEEMYEEMNSRFSLKWNSNERKARYAEGKINGKLVIFIQTYHGGCCRFKSKEYIEKDLRPMLDIVKERIKRV